MSYSDPKPAQFLHVRAPNARLAAVMTTMCGRRVCMCVCRRVFGVWVGAVCVCVCVCKCEGGHV
jgi:hypothetical protein